LFSGKWVTSGVFVDINCNIGFRQIGDSVLTCQDDGKWQGTISVCIQADVPSSGNFRGFIC
jgi:hypothetical protein